VQGDATLDAQFLGRVTGTGDNAAFSAGNKCFPSQLRVNGFFTGRKESIAVDVSNSPRPGLKAE